MREVARIISDGSILDTSTIKFGQVHLCGQNWGCNKCHFSYYHGYYWSPIQVRTLFYLYFSSLFWSSRITNDHLSFGDFVYQYLYMYIPVRGKLGLDCICELRNAMYSGVARFSLYRQHRWGEDGDTLVMRWGWGHLSDRGQDGGHLSPLTI